MSGPISEPWDERVDISYDLRLPCWCGAKYDLVRAAPPNALYLPPLLLRCANGHWMHQKAANLTAMPDYPGDDE